MAFVDGQVVDSQLAHVGLEATGGTVYTELGVPYVTWVVCNLRQRGRGDGADGEGGDGGDGCGDVHLCRLVACDGRVMGLEVGVEAGYM